LDSIKRGECRVLVATDIAARGIDIDNTTHVFNYDIPNIPETYVHRIGRTARAGGEGLAFSFCASEERGFLSDIERLIRKRIPVLPTPDGLALENKKKHRQQRQHGHQAQAHTPKKPSHSKPQVNARTGNPPSSPNNRRRRRQRARLGGQH
jgi:ATP-dependent RNA helicase RhlE